MYAIQKFSAPWGRLLIGMSLFCLVLFLALIIVGMVLTFSAEGNPTSGATMMILSLVFLVGGALFVIRGYELYPDRIEVLRPCWTTTIRLDGLQSIRMDSRIMKGSWRICGNGGLFSFTGWFWNKRLRTYRAFINDPRRSVVLYFSDHRVVVSPDDPEAFVDALQQVTGVEKIA